MKIWKSVMIFFVMALIFVFPAGAWAHSKLQISVPPADSTSTEHVKELSLTFNENINTTLSTLIITSDNGEKIDNAEVSIGDNLMKATLESPLGPGTYTVEWKIVGADGHPVKGNYSIHVEIPEEASEEAPLVLPADGQDQASETPEDTAQSSGNNNQAAEQPLSTSNADESGTETMWWVGMIIILGMIGLGISLKSRNRR
ncbi:copper resistance CopC family protein [Paenibacillus dakarensis]|uniref:copper resistance CopC family protein n=1 Tax=Paenibacillus dakarensis TaxID=1527293 RepID=UPI0006D5ABFD|nr:copper resistance protein CopC [Paenibacillus dakarensis]